MAVSGNKSIKAYTRADALRFRDRLRAVECPPDIIDQLGGWKTSGVGQSYGEGHQIDITSRWMQAIVLPASAAAPLSRFE